MTRRSLPIIKTVVPLVLAFFIGRMIHGNWQQVRDEPWRLDLGWLALSLVLAAAWYLIRPLGWTRLIGGFGHDLPYWEIYRVYRKSELSRYVPGGIWQFAARIYLTRRYGVSAAVCLAATMLDMTLAALAAMVPAAWLAGSASTSLGPPQRAALLAFPVIACTLVVPPVFNRWGRAVATQLGQPFEPLQMSALRMLRIWSAYVAMWILLAFAMASFARALLPGVDLQNLGYIAGCYALAWVTALLTIISPAGMGIREGILGLLLGQVLSAGTAMTLAVAMRLWIVCMELVWLVVGYVAPSTAAASPGSGSESQTRGI